MLHLFASGEVILTGGLFLLVADAVTPAEGGQGLVADLSLRLQKLLVYSDEVALTLLVKPQDLLAVVFGLLSALEPRDLH